MSLLAIASRELRNLFISPLAWVTLGFTQLLLAWLFLLQTESFIAAQPRLALMEGGPGLSDLVNAPLLGSTATVLLLLVPLLGMSLLSGEYRSGTYRLLFSAPVSASEIILGKYLGLMGFLGMVLLLPLAMCLSLYLGGSPDAGKLAAGMLGLFLIAGTFAAITLFVSGFSNQPATAAMGSFGLLLLLWIIGMASEGMGEGSPLFNWMSLQSHLNPMLKGLVRGSDVIYYLSLITAFLAMSIHHLRARRGEV